MDTKSGVTRSMRQFPMRKFRVALAQMNPTVGDLAGNQAAIEQRIDEAEALGVDLVTLGNNHIRDFMDAGVFDTRNHLDARGIKHVGSSANSRKFRELRALWG